MYEGTQKEEGAVTGSFLFRENYMVSYGIKLKGETS